MILPTITVTLDRDHLSDLFFNFEHQSLDCLLAGSGGGEKTILPDALVNAIAEDARNFCACLGVDSEIVKRSLIPALVNDLINRM